jgi:nitroreductase
MTLDDFEALVKTRRATRHFKSDPLPAGVLERLLGIAQWAPSGYNLQPTHFFVATAENEKKKLFPACMDQKQVLEAPATVVFCGDRRVKEAHFEKTIEQDRAAGAGSPEYEKLLRKFVPLAFDTGPLGIGWLWKSTLPHAGRFVRPIPQIPAADMDYWLAKQVALSAMVFMLAAHAAGLATVPMEGFDEKRVKKALAIPARYHVALVVPIGYGDGAKRVKSRVALKDVAHGI